VRREGFQPLDGRLAQGLDALGHGRVAAVDPVAPLDAAEHVLLQHGDPLGHGPLDGPAEMLELFEPQQGLGQPVDTLLQRQVRSRAPEHGPLEPVHHVEQVLGGIVQILVVDRAGDADDRAPGPAGGEPGDGGRALAKRGDPLVAVIHLPLGENDQRMGARLEDFHGLAHGPVVGPLAVDAEASVVS